MPDSNNYAHQTERGANQKQMQPGGKNDAPKWGFDKKIDFYGYEPEAVVPAGKGNNSSPSPAQGVLSGTHRAKQPSIPSPPARGMLYFCATPIGNMGDITLRALQCLKEADLIAVESMKRSRKLLHYYGIKAPLISYRESNRERKGREILAKLKAGARIVLITDAGMPAVSDPGFSLIRLLLAEKMPFTVLPGPSAVLTALVHSGYPANGFVFRGFLSRNKKERAGELQILAAERNTVVFYEAPHRLLKTLRELAAVLGEREIAVCRELTKKYEEVRRGSAGEMFEHFSRVPPRGEITLVLSPRVCDNAAPTGDAGNKEAIKEKDPGFRRAECMQELEKALQAGDPPTTAVKKVARSMDLPREKVYALLIEIKHDGGPA